MTEQQKVTFNEHALALIGLIKSLNPNITILIDCNSAEVLCGEHAITWDE